MGLGFFFVTVPGGGSPGPGATNWYCCWVLAERHPRPPARRWFMPMLPAGRRCPCCHRVITFGYDKGGANGTDMRLGFTVADSSRAGSRVRVGIKLGPISAWRFSTLNSLQAGFGFGLGSRRAAPELAFQGGVRL